MTNNPKLLSKTHTTGIAKKPSRARMKIPPSGSPLGGGRAIVRCPGAGEVYEFRYAKSGGWQFGGNYYCPATNCPHCGAPIGAVVAADGELTHITTTGSFVHTIESRIVEKTIGRPQRPIKDGGPSAGMPAMGM